MAPLARGVRHRAVLRGRSVGEARRGGHQTALAATRRPVPAVRARRTRADVELPEPAALRLVVLGCEAAAPRLVPVDPARVRASVAPGAAVRAPVRVERAKVPAGPVGRRRAVVLPSAARRPVPLAVSVGGRPGGPGAAAPGPPTQARGTPAIVVGLRPGLERRVAAAPAAVRRVRPGDKAGRPAVTTHGPGREPTGRCRGGLGLEERQASPSRRGPTPRPRRGSTRAPSEARRPRPSVAAEPSVPPPRVGDRRAMRRRRRPMRSSRARRRSTRIRRPP